MKRKLIGGLGLVLSLNGCAMVKAYKANQQLKADVGQAITRMADGTLDCPTACQMLKNYIKARYGQ